MDDTQLLEFENYFSDNFYKLNGILNQILFNYIRILHIHKNKNQINEKIFIDTITKIINDIQSTELKVKSIIESKVESIEDKVELIELKAEITESNIELIDVKINDIVKEYNEILIVHNILVNEVKILKINQKFIVASLFSLLILFSLLAFK